MESGLAEVNGECKRHERGEISSGKGGVRGKFLNYRRLYVRFNAFWKLGGGGGGGGGGGARISVILAKNLASLT